MSIFLPILAVSLLFYPSYLPKMVSDVNISDCDSIASSSSINIDPEVATAYTRGPERVVLHNATYLWQQHTDNTRAFSKHSVIWHLGDEYKRIGNSHNKRFWRCGIYKKTTMLACDRSSSAALRHLKRKHKINRHGQKEDTSQKTIASAFTATSIIATLVKRFNANIFRFLFIR